LNLHVMHYRPELTFGVAPTFATGGTYSEAIALKDLNRDGKLDVVTGIWGAM